MGVTGLKQSKKSLLHKKYCTYQHTTQVHVLVKTRKPLVRYGVKSIWASCAQLYSLAETLQPTPTAFGLI